MTRIKIVILFLTLFIFSSCVNQKENNSNTSNNSLNKNQAAHPNDFYFVGNINGSAGIYQYDFRKNIYHKFWSKTNASVVELSHSPKGDKIFFLTATSLGKSGVFPFIHNVKLYLLNPDSSSIKFIKLIGSGLQVFTAWETDNSFKVILNSFDITVANYINQHKIIYSEFGRKLVDETKTFDITKEGYPKPPVINKKIRSPYGEFSIAVKDTPETSIYLKNAHNKKIFIVSVSQKLNQIEWTLENKHLIFSTINITPRNNTLYSKKPETAKIFIYSIPDKKIIKEWNGGGFKNFILLKDLLIFDDGFSKKSSINIFDLKTLQITNSIRIKGGCGIRNIPSIPDYSA